MKRLAFLSVLLICAVGLVFSFDLGLVISQEIEAENQDFDAEDIHFAYTPAFTPWFSWDGGGKVSIYISNRFFFEYNYYSHNEPATGWAVPVFRTELTYSAINFRINDTMSLEGGRVEYDDAIGFAASGLFDGVRFKADFSKGAISVGVFYTGLLYRETAMIWMTANDIDRYYEPWDWGNNLGYCFASKRFLTDVRWDMPLKETVTLSAEFLAQVDVNNDEDIQKLHSEYIEVKAVFYPASAMEITGGFLFEFMQGEAANNSGAFGLLAGMKTGVPGSPNDMLKVTIKFTTGPWDDDSIAFKPISCVAQGDIFLEDISSLFYPSVDYSVRLRHTLLAEGSFRYYVNTDSNAENNAYGGELWASFTWQPVDDIRLKVGGGVFLPGMGNVYKDGDSMWRFDAVLTLSL
jgi:hypothetical protein